MGGIRESAQSWKELLLDLKRRGLAMAPQLAVADGALGFWKAIDEVWPKTRAQRCWVHKTANVLNKLPKSLHAKASVRCKTFGRRKPEWTRLSTPQNTASKRYTSHWSQPNI